MKRPLFIIMTACFVQGLLSGCGVTVQGIDLGRVVSATSKIANIGDKTEEEEIVIGQNTATVLLKNLNVADDEIIQRYVNKVGYRVASYTERPELPWRFVVVRNDAVNAFATPGGYVFITTGMIGVLQNEAELAGVLAHEVAHVVRKHHLHAIQQKSRTGLLADIIALSRQAEQRNSQDSEGGVDTQSTRITGHFDKAITDIYNRGLDRDDEHEADGMGAVIAARAGYDYFAFASVLQVLGSRTKDQDNLTRFLKTHPDTDDRLTELEDVLTYLEQTNESSRILTDRFIENTRN